MTKYFIPSQIYIQENDAANFYTKKMAYVSFKKNDEIVHQLIEPKEFNNTPRKGFILNKEVENCSSYFKNYNEARILDPLGFEYIISLNNLTEILKHSSIINGVFEEEMILAFQGKNLVLIPTKISEVNECLMKKQAKFELNLEQEPIFGSHYKLTIYDKETILVYLGQHTVNEHLLKPEEQKSGINKIFTEYYYENKKSKLHVFFDEQRKVFFYFKNLNTSKCQSNICNPNAEYYYLIFKSLNSLKLNIALIPYEGDIYQDLKKFLITNFKKKECFNSSNIIREISNFFSYFYFLSEDKEKKPILLGLKRERYSFDDILYMGIEVFNIKSNGFEICQRTSPESSSPLNLINNKQSKELDADLSTEEIIEKALEYIKPFLIQYSIVKLQLLNNEKTSIFGSPLLYNYLSYGYKQHKENCSSINLTI